MAPTAQQRILACLIGIATGDAVGKQTENLSRSEVLRWYPDGVRGFEGPPGTTIPRYRGNRKHEWLIGETTDDTERTLAVATAIVQEPRSRTHEHRSRTAQVPQVRASWLEVTVGISRGWRSRPGRRAPRRMRSGCPRCAGRHAPPPDRLDDIVAAAREVSVSTHAGPLAIAAAAANAAAVSAAVEGMPAAEIIALAQRAAAIAERERTHPPTTSFAEALDGIVGELTQWRQLNPATIAARYFPDSSTTIVGLALALGTVASCRFERRFCWRRTLVATATPSHRLPAVSPEGAIPIPCPHSGSRWWKRSTATTSARLPPRWRSCGTDA